MEINSSFRISSVNKIIMASMADKASKIGNNTKKKELKYFKIGCEEIPLAKSPVFGIK